MLVVLQHLLLCVSVSAAVTARRWDVSVQLGATARRLSVAEGEPILHAVERAGLLPSSDCRRGRCLSCAARVLAGAPFSLRVASDSALCEEAHAQGLVLLCSAFACGPDVRLELGLEGDAWEVQHSTRWRRDAPPPGDLGPERTHFKMPEDAAVLFDRTLAESGLRFVDELGEAKERFRFLDDDGGGDDGRGPEAAA